MELRWLIVKWEIWRDGFSNTVTDKPVLQFRTKEVIAGEERWSDWRDVPTVIESR